MEFIIDIFDKTSKMLSSLEDEFLRNPIIQHTNDILNRCNATSNYFWCDLYIDNTWINKDESGNEIFFDYYSPQEATATLAYFYFSIINTNYNSSNAFNNNSLVAVIVATNELVKNQSSLSQLKFNSRSYLFYIVINIDIEDEDLKKIKYDFAGKMVVIKFTNNLKKLFIEYVETKILAPDTMKDVQSLFFLKAIKPRLQEVYRTIITGKRNIEVLNSNRDTIRDELNRTTNDRQYLEVINKRKFEFNKSFKEVEKNIRRKYTDSLYPNTGFFSKAIEALTSKLATLETFDSLDNRFPKMITKVPPEYLKVYKSFIRGLLEKEFKRDKKELLDTIANLENQNQDVFIKLQNLTGFLDYNKVLNSFTELKKDYSGEIPKNTLQTYMMQIRQQTFFIYILLGLLNPLFAIPTWFGYKGNMLTSIPILVGGLISLALTVYFVIDLKRKTPVIKNEQMNKELDKFKKELFADGIRIIDACIREWQAAINNFLAESADLLNTMFDKESSRLTEDKKLKTDELEKNLVALQKGINQKSNSFIEGEKILLPLITEYSNNISLYENKVNIAIINFRKNIPA